MVDGGEVFGVVIGPVVGAWSPENSELALCLAAAHQRRRKSMDVSLFGTMVLLTKPSAVELSV